MQTKAYFKYLTIAVSTAALMGLLGCQDDRDLRDHDRKSAELEARETAGNKNYYDSTRSVSEIDKTPDTIGGPAGTTDMDRPGSGKTMPTQQPPP